jgi:uncharacterized protein YggE
MSVRSVVTAAAAAAVALAATPAVAVSAEGQAKTVTATGTGQVRVHPKDRDSNSSIAVAVDAARKKAITGALADAREYALDYAKAVGLSLGDVISISDQQGNGFFGPYGPGGFSGPFGPNRYCGTVSRPVGPIVRGVRPTFKKVHRCFVPPFAYSTLTVTYSAS